MADLTIGFLALLPLLLLAVLFIIVAWADAISEALGWAVALIGFIVLMFFFLTM